MHATAITMDDIAFIIALKNYLKTKNITVIGVDRNKGTAKVLPQGQITIHDTDSLLMNLEVLKHMGSTYVGSFKYKGDEYSVYKSAPTLDYFETL